MTDVKLLPCPFCGLDVTDDEGCFPLNREGTRWEVRCGNPSCFAYDPCDESMQAAVARWNRRATAARDAEIEALRAEVERLRAIAGCAYQMAGVHDAPEVWLDRLGQAANGDALPDPDAISDELLPYQPDAVCEAEARAERLAEALRERRDWFEAQAKSISKGNGSSWDLMQVREQRDLCDAALEQESNDA